MLSWHEAIFFFGRMRVSGACYPVPLNPACNLTLSGLGRNGIVSGADCAGDIMAWRDFRQLLRRLRAGRLRQRTARVERTPGRGMDGAGRFPLGKFAFHFASGVGFRCGLEQSVRVGMHRSGEQALRRRDFHNMAEVHDRHMVGNMPYHIEIMADEEIGQSQRLPQVLKQIKNLGLDTDIERRAAGAGRR
ncbi:MAG: hypothetical protein BWY09_02247 [Candidatus Hydrogenedentes bacterium ADurb.Bin179]|nr:MAG: hypothetical protein BWY09_02247 [Candidatus Hydrogenedentes bacterium ADurb.Bin179]